VLVADGGEARCGEDERSSISSTASRSGPDAAEHGDKSPEEVPEFAA
jgi:hypothetical protein